MTRRLAVWKSIWDARTAKDKEYFADCAVERVLRAEIVAGREIADGMEPLLEKKTGLAPDICAAAFERLVWRNVLKRKFFDPPRPSTYRMTRRSAARTPLHSGGSRFRPALRRDGNTWGPQPLDEDAIPAPIPIKISEGESLAIFAEIDALIPKKFYGEPRTEIIHQIYVDVLAGALNKNDIEKAVNGYIARELVQDGHQSLDGNAGIRLMLETI